MHLDIRTTVSGKQRVSGAGMDLYSSKFVTSKYDTVYVLHNLYYVFACLGNSKGGSGRRMFTLLLIILGKGCIIDWLC